MKLGRKLLAVLGIALVVTMAFAGTALAQGPMASGEALCEEFVDLDQDGICDNRPADHPLLRAESEDWVAGQGYRAGGEGLEKACDLDGDGVCDCDQEFVDENNDGICDNMPEDRPFGRGRMTTES